MKLALMFFCLVTIGQVWSMIPPLPQVITEFQRSSANNRYEIITNVKNGKVFLCDTQATPKSRKLLIGRNSNPHHDAHISSSGAWIAFCARAGAAASVDAGNEQIIVASKNGHVLQQFTIRDTAGIHSQGLYLGNSMSLLAYLYPHRLFSFRPTTGLQEETLDRVANTAESPWVGYIFNNGRSLALLDKRINHLLPPITLDTKIGSWYVEDHRDHGVVVRVQDTAKTETQWAGYAGTIIPYIEPGRQFPPIPQATDPLSLAERRGIASPPAIVTQQAVTAGKPDPRFGRFLGDTLAPQSPVY